MSGILDSGDRTEFSTGAVRDMRVGKGRFDLAPLDVIANMLSDESVLPSLAKFMDDGDPLHLYRALYVALTSADINGKTMFDGCVFTMVLELAVHFEEGAAKYGPDNWRLGIDPRCYVDSAVRHYIKWLRGDDDERHDRAFVWNVVCCIWEVKQERSVNWRNNK